MEKQKDIAQFIDILLRVFRDMKQKEINEIMRIFDKNESLRLEGYGWKKVPIRCHLVRCGWKGRRIWGKKMFSKPCPRCKTISPKGNATLFAPHVIYEKE